jgi:hypothetical protein
MSDFASDREDQGSLRDPEPMTLRTPAGDTEAVEGPTGING